MLVDRLLATMAGFTALGAVLAIVGAALGRGHPAWVCPWLFGAFALVLVRVLVRAAWAGGR